MPNLSQKYILIFYYFFIPANILFTIAGEGLQKLGLFSANTSVEYGGIFHVKRSHLRSYQFINQFFGSLNKKVRREGEIISLILFFFYFGDKNYEASDYNKNISISFKGH